MSGEIAGGLLGGCCGSILTQIQYSICNTRQYGTDANCCDNCCRFNCCWKQGALPVEDYPIANSAPEDRTQHVDSPPSAVKKEGDEATLPAYAATAQMSTTPAPHATAGDVKTAQT
ncbi:uncharacterized protein UTRI_05053 [Ustilago trichophora]|uniref:Uncharacterized protein n=1 Tax=Ustilago trichophora TaxID=86804 RepID=A0A5C3ECI9_9BASI|nr:uncharacterized protein UTRI_05053 [Ustilago trichophora]